MHSLRFLGLILSFFTFSTVSFAYNGDISINSQNLKFSDNNFLEGKTVRIYAQTSNSSSQDLLGIVRFFDNGNQIGGDQPVSIFAGTSDGVFIDWTPRYGTHRVSAKIYPWETSIDDPSNNWVVTEIFAVQDTDHDGTPNDTDTDDDGDNVSDTEDIFPLDPKEQYDTDGDGIGDNSDDDADNDGVPNEFDDLPLNSEETIDTDKDGMGNIEDLDDDEDGLNDNDEENNGTNPLIADTDEDGVNDGEDLFPINPLEQYDTDSDSIGNNTDIDDDNDGIPDTEDEYPLNKGPVIKLSDNPNNVGLFEKYIFDATPSHDDDGDIVSFLWEIDGKIIREGNSVDYRFDKLGNHIVKLTVTDDSGESKSSEFQVNVLNLGLYKQIAVTLAIILLALIMYLKYIGPAKKDDKSKKS